MGKPWENVGLMGFCGIYPLVMANIAIENGHRNSEYSQKIWWFSIAMLNYQRVTFGLGGYSWIFSVIASTSVDVWIDHMQKMVACIDMSGQKSIFCRLSKRFFVHVTVGIWCKRLSQKNMDPKTIWNDRNSHWIELLPWLDMFHSWQ